MGIRYFCSPMVVCFALTKISFMHGFFFALYNIKRSMGGGEHADVIQRSMGGGGGGHAK